MRPTPAETIAGIRRILRDVVEPAVGSEYARTRLREIRAVLAQIDWDDAALNLRRRRDALVGLLGEVRAWSESDPARQGVFDDLAGRMDAVPAPEPESFATLNAAEAAYAAILADVAQRLAAWTREHPEDTEARELRMRLLRHFAG